jgi:hypothetical protein
MKPGILRALAGCGLFAATSLSGQDNRTEVFDLDAFSVEQTALSRPESLSPADARTGLLFGEELGYLDIARGFTAISAATRQLLGIDDLESLATYGAGSQRVNYFGLAGAPFMRGARAATYFNGMLRAYQRNEMPLSFGSAEGLQLVKGPTPANLSPGLVGGLLNQEPKSPYYDRARGSLELGVGAFATRHWQLDAGAPLLLGRRPAAYRVSYSGHRAERAYDFIRHDYDSLYGALKIKLDARRSLFVGGELYDYRSSEAPGHNRPTPQLLATRAYVLGEPPDLSSAAWGGTAVRTLTEYPYTQLVQPALHALAVPGEIARAEIAPGLLGLLINLNEPAQLERVYALRPAAAVPAYVHGGDPATLAHLQAAARAALDQVDVRTQDAYVYTPAYFAAGGRALTRTISRTRILADPRDFADARNFIAFADLDTRLDGDRSWRLRGFAEGLESDKVSTYGFAMRTRQMLANLLAEYRAQAGFWDSSWSAGLDWRIHYGKMLQDFDAEPFSRRDLTRATISGNSVVAAGAATDPAGQRLWSSYAGATQLSHLQQVATFITGRSRPTERLELFYGARVEQAWYRTALPAEVAAASPAERAARRAADDVQLYQLTFNPLYRIHPGLSAYLALQLGRAIAPADGGTIAGRSSFTDVELSEAGLKGVALARRLAWSLAAYHWDQATYSTRDAAANPLRARGLEFESTWSATDRLTLLAAFTAQRVHLRQETVGFGAIPLDEQGWALNGGILNGAGGRDVRARNPDMVFAGVPEVSAHLYAVAQLPGNLQLSGGPLWRDGHWSDMGRTLRIPSSVLWNLQLAWQRGPWQVSARVENLFDAAYWIALDPVFAAGTLVLPGERRRWDVTVRYAF